MLENSRLLSVGRYLLCLPMIGSFLVADLQDYRKPTIVPSTVVFQQTPDRPRGMFFKLIASLSPSKSNSEAESRQTVDIGIVQLLHLKTEPSGRIRLFAQVQTGDSLFECTITCDVDGNGCT